MDQSLHTSGPSEEILKNSVKFCEQSTIDYDVTVDRQKKSFIKPGES